MSLNSAFTQLQQQLETRIIGQHRLINRLLIALLADGHLLVEGAPGLAKTRAIKSLAACLEGSFQRIQFTPDLLPADITGTDIYHPQTGDFSFQEGPIFHHFILADEINRAPAKVQSALLEAMAERQVSSGHRTWPLAHPFLVMATQNPLEHEGTFPLPEAQLDRFLLHVSLTYPNLQEEARILELARAEWQNTMPDAAPSGLASSTQDTVKLSREVLQAAQAHVLQVYMAPELTQYMLHLIMATRQPQHYDPQMQTWLTYGASPRATLALDRCARAHAWLAGRDHVEVTDIQALAPDVLRHRLILSYLAQAEGINKDACIQRLLEIVPCT
ncbi:MoxR-like ATPase [Allopseudospirillum japonicum]|uniref:MoxR-like ATPase n=1 Tax=Allopseudospirillum japonicum TaxID=64971 RepID=A0A1H6T922_9GAMM|nr:MoxR family ATPase [Allopseudospirillum japonicum]SEI72725.1 MoxR-like ATPase [Allopseudospirillum japonicum]